MRVRDTASGARSDGTGLQACLQELTGGDTVEASELQIGEPVRLVRRGRGREGIIEGIQFALAPYGSDKVVVRLDAGGRVQAIPEELEWIKRRKD